MKLGWVACLWLALSSWLLTGVVHAAGGQTHAANGQAMDRCSAVRALDELSAKERASISTACADPNAPQTLDVPHLLRRLERGPSWKRSLLLSLLAEALPKASADVHLVALKKRLDARTRDCKLTHAAFERDAAARKEGKAAFGAPLVTSDPARCEAKLPGAQDMPFVVEVGRPGDRVQLAARARGSSWTAQSVDVSVELNGVVYFIARVEAGSEVVIRHDTSDPSVSARTAVLTVRTDWATPTSVDENAAYCVEFEGVAAKARKHGRDGFRPVVLLDGDPVPLEPTDSGGDVYFYARRFVRKEQHELVVIDAGGRVRARSSISPEELSETGCVTRPLDLTDRKNTTLLVSVSDDCARQGIVQPRIYFYARAILKHALGGRTDGGTFQEFEAWATTLAALGRWRDSVTDQGSKPVGGDRGELDTERTVQALAGELIRRGFGRAYVGHLSCGEISGAPTYTFVVHRLHLEVLGDMAAGRLRGPRGLVDSLLTTHETVVDQNDLRDLIRAPLSRLLERPYARLETSGAKREIYRDTSQPIEAWHPRTRVPATRLRVLRLPSGETERYCAGVMRRRSLVNPQPFEHPNAFEVVRDAVVLEPETPTSEPRYGDGRRGRSKKRRGPRTRVETEVPSAARVELGVDAAGTYVVELRTSENRDVTSATYDCVTVGGYESADRFSGQAWVLPAIRDLHPSRDSGGSHVGLLFKASLGEKALSTRLSLSVPFVLGYTTANRSLRAPPSWDDLDHNLVFDDSGRLPVLWQRRAIVVGLEPELRWKFVCTIEDVIQNDAVEGCSEFGSRWRLAASVASLVDVGLIFTGQVPEGLMNFRGDREPHSNIVDIDTTLLGQLKLLLRVTRSMELGAGVGYWVLGWDDLLAATSAQPAGAGHAGAVHDGTGGLAYSMEIAYYP